MDHFVDRQTRGSLVWTLDGETSPVLATGLDPTVAIPEGVHSLRLTATDSAGHVVFDELSIEGAPPPATSREIVSNILGTLNEALSGADVNNNDIIDIADVIARQLEITAPPSPAAGSQAVDVESASGAPQCRVRLPVRLSGSAAVAGVNLRLEYDPEILQSPRVERGDSLTSGAHVAEFNVPASGKLNLAVYAPTTPTLLQTSSVDDFYLSFQIRNGAPVGTVTTIALAQPIAGPPALPASALTDLSGKTVSHTFGAGSVEVLDPALAPVIGKIPDASTAEGLLYTGPTPTLTGGAIAAAWSLVSGPAGMTIDGNTGQVSWPKPAATGNSYKIAIRADGPTCSDEESWILSIRAPVPTGIRNWTDPSLFNPWNPTQHSDAP